MKGKDLYIFIVLTIISFFVGSFSYHDYTNYSDIVTFLSIMIGFKITSLSIIFHSPLKKNLYDRKINLYRTELHRLRDFYKFSIYVSCINIVLILLIPNDNYNLSICSIDLCKLSINKSMLVLPILISSLYCFIRLCNELFTIFVYPTKS